MATQNGSAPGKRCHIVLVPGFGGFDALGRIEYYAGITNLFQDWCKAERQSAVALHYFDNLPTAAVVTRADRLRKYLAKRIARQEMAHHDRIVLVGHSTGGLDIRQLICDLNHPGKGPVPVDGGLAVPAEEILGHIDGVVFLSVPHWGTNIAEWVYSNAALRSTVLGNLRLAFEGSQSYLLDRFEAALAEGAWGLTGSEMLLAVRDTFTEANDDWSDDPTRLSDAQEAASELQLYFRQMARNFHVIEDLAPVPHNKQTSPAHFSPKERKDELEHWKKIRTLSYATVGGRAYQFQAGRPAPMLSVVNPCDYVRLLATCEHRAETDIGYRLCYRACAGGPLEVEKPGQFDWVLGAQAPLPLELWDNDGIVNTISMLWPAKDASTVLVQADHLDIVGHRLLRKAPREHGRSGEQPPRIYESYDTLKSAPHFKHETLKHVWEEIFAFAARNEFPLHSRAVPKKAKVGAV